jgi:DNA-binding transcriptional regulator YbjK
VGARGLTHRAVDQQAGLPPGSTSFYCRSRLDLLSLALVRHGSLDMADLEADAQALAAQLGADGRQARAPLSLFIDGLAARIATWLSPEGRDRMVARFELFLIASHEPELTPVVQAQRQRFRDAATAALQALGLPDAQTLAPALLMTVDGILLAHVARSDAPLARDQVCAMLRRAVGC